MARITHFEKDQIIAKLSAECAALRARVSQLEGDVARAAPQPRGDATRKWDARRSAARRYFAAHPEARSVTPAQLAAFVAAQQ